MLRIWEVLVKHFDCLYCQKRKVGIFFQQSQLGTEVGKNRRDDLIFVHSTLFQLLVFFQSDLPHGFSSALIDVHKIISE